MDKDTQFNELTSSEIMCVNGGLGGLAIFGLGLLGTAIAAGANEIVKETTGQGIGDHVVDGAIWVWDAVTD
jgi:hypothetical protein